ncbi:MAG: hypothetical protein KJO43_10730 [Phycisphaerae bacterium]|nr:hypothetical protein [Phycisphaerae bacterium]
MLLMVVMITISVLWMADPSRRSRPPAPADVGAGDAPDGEGELAVDESGLVAPGVLCRACGYNLQGLEPDGLCPECSTPTARSLRGDLLKYCAPSWLRRLQVGLLWIIVGIIVQAVLMSAMPILAGVVSGVTAAAGLPSGGAMMTTIMVAFGLLMGGLNVLYVIGAWLVTERDPGRADDEPVLSARRLARYGIAAAVISGPLQTVWQQGGRAGWAAATPGVVAALVVVAITVLGVATIVGWVSFLVYMRRLVLRIPQRALARHARIVMWGYGSYMSLGLIVGVLAFTAFPGGTPPAAAVTPQTMSLPLIILVVGACLMVPAGLLFEIWAVVLFFFCRNALRDVESQTRTHAWEASVPVVGESEPT